MNVNLLKKIKNEDGKVLIFSQMTMFLKPKI